LNRRDAKKNKAEIIEVPLLFGKKGWLDFPGFNG
jgi:hypothetical protein